MFVIMGLPLVHVVCCRRMQKYRHLFFDMDKTIAPARQPILPEMFDLLTSLSQDIIVVSGQTVENIRWQSNDLDAIILGQNGSHAIERDGTELWNEPLDDAHRAEIMAHIERLIARLPERPREEWTPIEDRGSQITFSPIGNMAPVEEKAAYDPDRSTRESLLAQEPFVSDNVLVKIGGSTSFDYIHKNRHKGTNVARLIELKGWDKDECVYIGDGLYPGGNDELVIGVIDTIPVKDHLDTYEKLRAHFVS